MRPPKNRALLAMAALLFIAGCQKPDTTGRDASPAAAPSTGSASRNGGAQAEPADPTAPVATLLGKPVYRRDFFADVNPNSADTKFHSLILTALIDDFRRREVSALSQEEIDAFWGTLMAAAQRSAGTNEKPPQRAFDEAKVQAQLDETRAKLANADAPWLERLQLEGLEGVLVFALQHKTVAAHEAFMHLMPLRCQKALYEKYGGKVVGLQISIEPIGAYQRLIAEAEAAGQLKFHDADLELAFRNRMLEYAQRTEIQPEHVDFSLPAWLQISLRRPASTGAAPAAATGAAPAAPPPAPAAAANGPTTAPPPGDADLPSRFVGVWQTRAVDRPAKWNPAGGESTVHEVTHGALQKRILLGHEHNQTDGRKALYVTTYDEAQHVYLFWMFDSRGALGSQWQLTWNAATQTATGHATDTPAGWTSHGTNQFPDAPTCQVHFWMKDETGALLMEANATKQRQPDETGAAYLAAWSKVEPQADLPAELRRLDRLVGTWDVVSDRKPASPTASGVRLTGTMKREWILDGRFVMGRSTMSDGSEGLALFSFDPGEMKYRNWFFNSLGHRYASRGSWDEGAQTLTLTARDAERTTRISIQFESADREVWHTRVEDAAGKVLFEMDSTVTRRAGE